MRKFQRPSYAAGSSAKEEDARSGHEDTRWHEEEAARRERCGQRATMSWTRLWKSERSTCRLKARCAAGAGNDVTFISLIRVEKHPPERDQGAPPLLPNIQRDRVSHYYVGRQFVSIDASPLGQKALHSPVWSDDDACTCSSELSSVRYFWPSARDSASQKKHARATRVMFPMQKSEEFRGVKKWKRERGEERHDSVGREREILSLAQSCAISRPQMRSVTQLLYYDCGKFNISANGSRRLLSTLTYYSRI